MLNFTPLDKDVLKIKGYPERSNISFCDISLGVKYMWRKDFRIDYAFFGDTLIMKETCRDYKNAFYYPIGGNEEGALLEIENYCIRTGTPLKFCCIDNETAVKLSARYSVEITNDRAWSDYIYSAEKFKTYSGKKYSGQRNHVNKFKRNYPDYQFHILTEGDMPKITRFLAEFEHNAHFSDWTAVEEQKNVLDYAQNCFKLGQLGGYITVGERVVAMSLGEIVGDTLIVHVEKGLYSFEGVYPTMAQEFAKAFAHEGVKFINREEDCGDMGLRISKLQYHPVEIRQKNIVTIKTVAQNIPLPIKIQTERLTVESTSKKDDQDYYRLSIDDENNKLWGYDYREDLGENEPNVEYFSQFREELEGAKEEFSLAVKIGGQMVGEIVLWNFAHDGGVEIGTRFFPEHQKKGYAFESISGVIKYLKEEIGVKKLRTRAFFENFASNKLFQKIGFGIDCKDNEKNYYILNF